jgi:hypothetical protein
VARQKANAKTAREARSAADASTLGQKAKVVVVRTGAIQRCAAGCPEGLILPGTGENAGYHVVVHLYDPDGVIRRSETYHLTCYRRTGMPAWGPPRHGHLARFEQATTPPASYGPRAGDKATRGPGTQRTRPTGQAARPSAKTGAGP